MDNYIPNSHKFKEESKNAKLEKKEIKRVTKGSVKTKKKSEIGKLKDTFIAEDISTVGNYIFSDVIIPAVKKAISTVVRDGIDMLLFGETSKKRGSNSINYVSYRDYARDYDYKPSDSKFSSYSRFDYREDLVFESRGEVEAVRDQMNDIIDRYGFVTVADMYEMADPNITPPYTSNKYGWSSIRSAEPIRVHGGYILKLPRPIPMD